MVAASGSALICPSCQLLGVRFLQVTYVLHYYHKVGNLIYKFRQLFTITNYTKNHIIIKNLES